MYKTLSTESNLQEVLPTIHKRPNDEMLELKLLLLLLLV